jgi:FMN phosphatase YigB (HAD superfamily)
MTTIALDLDDTLVDTTSVLLDWLEARTGNRLADDRLAAYALGADAAETDAIVAAFHADQMDRKIHPLDGAVDACRKLDEAGYRLVVVTSRKTAFSAHTLDLVERCFPGIFAEIHSIGYTADKATTLRDLDAALFIDDHFRHIEQAATAGIPSILFRDLPWSRKRDWPIVPPIGPRLSRSPLCWFDASDCRRAVWTCSQRDGTNSRLLRMMAATREPRRALWPRRTRLPRGDLPWARRGHNSPAEWPGCRIAEGGSTRWGRRNRPTNGARLRSWRHGCAILSKSR